MVSEPTYLDEQDQSIYGGLAEGRILDKTALTTTIIFN